MPRIDPIQEAFTAGEISPRLLGRVSLDLYKAGLSKCENFLVYPHGGVTKRGGFRYVAEVKDSTKTTILQKFNYKDEFQYVFEFGHNYIRVFRNQAAVEYTPYVWTPRTSAADNDWVSVCWSPELSLFCAVADTGTGNRVMTSPDGVTWTIRTSAADNYWQSVCWSPELSLFCAVAMSGTDNRVMTSPDGITWTIRTSAANNNWRSVCWSPELSLFCAVANTGTGDRVMTSPDGITWTARNAAADNEWYSVCWSPEISLFCAVAMSGTGNRVMTSPDGITWDIRTSAVDNYWFSVCWSPELLLFCAVAITGSGNRVMTSPDGITWTIRTSAANNDWHSVYWSPELSLFCAIADTGTGDRVMTSPDGITWTVRTSAADNSWYSVCWSPELSLFCAVAYSGTGNRVMTSLGGVVEIVTTYTETEVQDLRFIQDEEKLFIVHKDHLPAELIRTNHNDWTLQNVGFSNRGVLTVDNIVEPELHVWTSRASATANSWNSVCWSPELEIFCAVSSTGSYNRIMTSPDGVKWTTRLSSADYAWISVCWSPELSLFCAVHSTGENYVMTSPDGVIWTTRGVTASPELTSICWSPELTLFCAIAKTYLVTSSQVVTSPDGITWTLRVVGNIQTWTSICWSPELSLFCAVADSGTTNRVVTSPDGITWTTRTSATDSDWQSVCWSPELSLFCAVADVGASRAMTSPNGITWTFRSVGLSRLWTSICWSPELGLFCAVAKSGTSNRVITSPNGITWTTRESAMDNLWNSVCWSPELMLFCAVAESGLNTRVMTGYAGMKDGTYTEVKLTSDEEDDGSGAEATVVVTNNVIDTITLTEHGALYEVNDNLTIEPTDIGGSDNAVDDEDEDNDGEENLITCDVATLTVNDIPDEWEATNYPTLIWFFEQRLWLAATPNESNQVWGSRSADYFNLFLGEGLDDEGIALTVKSATKLLWAIDGNTAIIFGAHNGEFKLASNSLNDALTPSNIRPVQITNYGNAFVPVVQINSDILFVQKGLRTVRRLRYEYASNSYGAMPVNIISEHITESGIVDVAYGNEPNSIFWAIRTDGILIAMTYEPDSKVFGWHRHPIGGTDVKVQSIASIDGAFDVAKDELWAIIERTIDGKDPTTRKYVEFLVPEGLSLEDNIEDAFFVESGVTKTGSGSTTFDGLDHLEGEEVRILADGVVQVPKTVSGGEITLDTAADKAHAGLAYNASIETLPLEGGNPIGTAQAKIKRISSMVLRLYRSLTFYMGDVLGNEDVYSLGPSVFTGDTEEQAFPGGYDTQGKVRIASYDPVPLTILAIMYELRVKD